MVQVLLDHKADPNIQETKVRLCAGGRVWGLRSRRALSRAFARFFQLDYVAWPTIVIPSTNIGLPLCLICPHFASVLIHQLDFYENDVFDLI